MWIWIFIQTQKYRHDIKLYVFVKKSLTLVLFFHVELWKTGICKLHFPWLNFSTWFFATDWDIEGLVLHSASSTLAASTEGKFLTLKNAYNYYCTSTILLSPPAYDGKHSWAGPKVLWFGTLPPFKSLRMNAGLKSLN